MKWLLTLTFLWSFSAFAITHKEFVKLPRDKRALIIDEYKKFLKEYTKTVELTSARPVNFIQFIEAAYAANFDCVYGGWPSQRSNGLCSLPTSNPAFQRESCGQNEMPCQPLLFGRGICVGKATRQQRNSAFANCQNKFNSMGRTLSDVVEYISDPQVSTEADELFRLVDEICRTGAQASTPMCANLKSRVAAIQSQRDAPARPAERPAPQEAVVAPQKPAAALTVASEDAGRLNQLVEGLNNAPRCLTCEAMREQTTDEQPQRTPDPQPQVSSPATNTAFPRIWSGYDLAACGSSRSTPEGYDLHSVGSCSGGEKVLAGYAFRPGPGNPFTNVQTRYPNGGPPGRFWELDSRNQAFNETYLIMEEYGGGPDSHNVKSYMFLLPRVTVPSVKVEGNNLIATLPTGETVTMDKNTRVITSGALTEGPIDLNTDRFQRKPPNINYNGTGISIRLDHRYEHPLTGPATATIKQGSKTCSIPRTAILDDEGRLKTETDAALLAVLNQNCRGGGFRL